MYSLSLMIRKSHLTGYLPVFVGATFAFMWKMTGAVLEDVNKPRKPQRTVHPEMKDVQSGDELLVFKANDDDKSISS